MTASDNKNTRQKPKKKRRKWLNYTINSLLAIILLILIIPSWRSAFQSWYAQLTLSNVEFEQTTAAPIPEDQKNWELFNSEGKLLNFAEFEGKPVVIQFWATWCTYCKASFPDLSDLRDNFKDEVVFMAVTEESVDVINESGYTDEYDFLYSTQRFPEFFQIQVYPTLVIMDKQMNLVFSMEGAGDINNDENVTFLKGLL